MILLSAHFWVLSIKFEHNMNEEKYQSERADTHTHTHFTKANLLTINNFEQSHLYVSEQSSRQLVDKFLILYH